MSSPPPRGAHFHNDKWCDLSIVLHMADCNPMKAHTDVFKKAMINFGFWLAFLVWLWILSVLRIPPLHLEVMASRVTERNSILYYTPFLRPSH